MALDVGRILDKLGELEDGIERELEKGRARFHYHVAAGRVRFERGVAEAHRRLKTGLGRYLAQSGALTLLAAPLVYLLVVPLALLDVLTVLFVQVGFPVYGIAKVKRGDFVAVDRHHLAYLNLIEKLNCVYCSYANGVIAFAREVASRSEEHWCPIKHARRVRDPHRRYYRFADYGDAEGFHAFHPADERHER